MALEKTLTANNKVRLSIEYPVVAGVDKDNVPQLLKLNPDGRLDLGGVILPKWDSFSIINYGATNNARYVIYFLTGIEVARWTLVYFGGAAADNDLISSGTLSTT